MEHRTTKNAAVPTINTSRIVALLSGLAHNRVIEKVLSTNSGKDA